MPEKELGRRGTLVLCVAILVLGLASLSLLGWLLYRDLVPYVWDETQCRILASSIVEPASSREIEYGLEVKYVYEYDGREHVSERVGMSWTGDPDYRAVFELFRTYREGAAATCYVDPSDPARAVLIHHVQWFVAPLMLIPILMIFGGVLGMRSPRRTRGRRGGRIVGLLFFGLMFLIPGLLLLLLGVLLPALNMRSARSWEEVPCTVLSARSVLQPADYDDPAAYAPDIVYAYHRDGREHRSNRYGFGSFEDPDPAAIDGIIARYPVGRERICYVDPDDPANSVLHREFEGSLIVWGLLSLPFLGIGVWGCFRIRVKARRRRPR